MSRKELVNGRANEVLHYLRKHMLDQDSRVHALLEDLTRTQEYKREGDFFIALNFLRQQLRIHPEPDR